MTREEAIRILDPETSIAALVEIEYYHGFAGHIARVEATNEACKIAVAAMRELAALESHSKALENNEPLTPAELRQMNGEPVWIAWPDGRISDRWWIVGSLEWHRMEFHDDYTFRDYGKTFVAYRHKPEVPAKANTGTIAVRDLYDEDGQEVPR